MPDQVPNQAVQGGVVQGAVDDDAKFKTWLKEKYEIEDDPDSFKTKRNAWKKAEEELPQYQSTLTALIDHIKANQNAVEPTVKQAPEDDEERLRNISKIDPYEGAKRYFAKKEKELEERLQKTSVEAAQQAEYNVVRREGLRRAHDIVKTQWPEAFDTNTDLHKMGKQVFQQEMSPQEQQHPMAFLIATERAAGRLGVAPKGKRGGTPNRRDQVEAQNISRSGVKGSTDSDDKPLSARQRQVAAGVGVDEKTYKEALRVRKEQKKKKEDDD